MDERRPEGSENPRERRGRVERRGQKRRRGRKTKEKEMQEGGARIHEIRAPRPKNESS